MKAARIHGPRTVTYDTVDDPKIEQSRDIILKVTATAICGSDYIFIQEGCRNHVQ